MKKSPWIIEVPVTQEDIDKGRSYSPYCCPIALACNRLDKHHIWSIGVIISARYRRDRDNSIDYYSLSSEANDFVHTFDAGADVQPQTVRLYHLPGAMIQYYGEANEI